MFIGRDAELAELERGFDRAVAGTGRLVLIDGPPGIGKTRLADELGTVASGRGAAVVWGRSWEGGGAPAYAPWTDVLRSLFRQTESARVRERLDDAAVLADLVPELVPVLGSPPRAQELDPVSARFRLFRAVTSFLVEAASDRPVAVVLDDLHACDMASLLLLRFVARRLAESRILVIGTYRDGELGEDESASLADLARERVARRIRLRGLESEEVRRMIDGATGAASPQRVVDALYRHTDGNPLFLEEAIRQLTVRGRLADPDESAIIAVPRELRQAVLRGLERISPPCRALLSLAAVAGREFRVGVLAAVESVPDEAVLGPLSEARVAGVVDSVPDRAGVMRFGHALLREALYEEIAPARRAELHRRVGEALEQLSSTDRAAPLAELAHHFLRAGGDMGRAVRYARAAGDHAGRLLAYEEAVRHYRAALGASDREPTPSDADRCDLLLSLGDALARAGEQDAAREVFLRAAGAARSAGEPDMLARAALGYGGRFVWARAGGDPHIRGLLADALAALPTEDGPLRARVMARLAGILRDDPAREPRWSLSAEAVATARRLTDPATLAYALESRWAAIWEPGTVGERREIADQLIRLAEVAADPERALQAHGLRLHTLFELGDLDGVRTEHRIERRLVETVRQPAQRWLVAVGTAALSLFDGRFAEAEGHISAAIGLGRRAQSTDAEVSFRLQTYVLRRETSGVEATEAMVRESIEEFPWYPMFRCILVDLYARTGRDGEARAVLAALSADGFGGLPLDSQWVFSISLLGDAAAALGDADRSATLYRMLSPSARLTAYSPPEVSTGSVARTLGGLAAACERWEEAVGHFEDAIVANGAMGATPWLAHSYVGLASALLGRAGGEDGERAASLLDDARGICERLGMRPLQDRIAGMERGGESASEPETLFRREGDVWSIAFEGRSYRLTDSKGMRYLAELLRSPGREILALDLAAAGPGERRGSAAGDGLQVEGASGTDVLDPQARAAYRRRLEDLREELDEAESWSDTERASRTREELDFVVRELATATGLGGRSRKAGSPAERARQSVTKALRLAIERIGREDPALGHHLEATVRTGTFCSYAPDPRSAVPWRQ